MKKNVKWLTLALAACGAFVGCGDDSSSADLNLEKSFDIVLSKANYSYRSKDSTLVIKNPECKESSLGYLVWNKEGVGDTLKAYRRDSYAYYKKPNKDEFEKVGFEGKTFPAGTWFNTDDARESIREAQVFNKSQMEEVFQYTGTCFMKSYYGQMFDNDVVEEADDAMSDFYTMFQTDKDYELEEKDLVHDLRAASCDELTLFDGDVSIKIDNFRESSGKIVLGYKKHSCDITFNIRYAIDEKDCSAAYDDYKADNDADDDFDFYSYWKTVEYSHVCVSRLVLQFQEDKGILKKTRAMDESESKKVAGSAVDLILSGFEK